MRFGTATHSMSLAVIWPSPADIDLHDVDHRRGWRAGPPRSCDRQWLGPIYEVREDAIPATWLNTN